MQDRVVVVTGGFGVLGTAVARSFAAIGATVVLIDRAPEVPPSVAREFAGHSLIGGIDLSDAGQALLVIGRVVESFGRLNVLVNVAGGFRWETMIDGSIETWDLLYIVNLKTAVCSCRAALPALLASGGGRIINIGAFAAAKAASGMGAYAASKAGVAKLTEALAEELKDCGVTVNAILPSTIDTPQNRREMPNAEFDRWVRPEAIASLSVFLASKDAAAITGASIPVVNRC